MQHTGRCIPKDSKQLRYLPEGTSWLHYSFKLSVSLYEMYFRDEASIQRPYKDQSIACIP